MVRGVHIKMRSTTALVLAGVVGLVHAQSITTTAGPSLMTSTTTLKLARSYSGNNFFDGFNFETADDPTGGYVNYVSQSAAQSNGLASVQSDGAVIMRVNTEGRASGRGRDSVRISSKDEYADGVYILDMNHMPVGCGVWPAWWTTVKNGWPSGSEIDILEGANILPSRNGAAWNATGNITAPATQKTTRNVGSLHTSKDCTIQNNAYMTGAVDANTCSAYVNGNQGCGAVMGGNTTYGIESLGSQVNDVGGGWYAMWRDMENSGGVYIYFWPRNSPNVPEDVRNPNAGTTNVQGWGQPGANLTTPGCKGDFYNHVIVFNMAFCGDYTAATYGQSGCPTSTSCQALVMNTPGAFAETYWSINSLRVYTASGAPAVRASSGLTTAQIAGIAVGAAGAVVILGLIYWRYRVTKRRRINLAADGESSDSIDNKTPPNQWATPDELPPLTGGFIRDTTNTDKNRSQTTILTAKPRTGRTTLAPGKTARHHLEGETAAGFYHDQAASGLDITPDASAVNLARPVSPGIIPTDRRLSSVRRESVAFDPSGPQRGSVSSSSGGRLPASPTGSVGNIARRQSAYGLTEQRLSTHSFSPSSAARRDSTFQGEQSRGSWVG